MIPKPTEPLLLRGAINPVWWQYWREGGAIPDDSGILNQINALAARVDALGGPTDVRGIMSVVVYTQHDGTRAVQLLNDSALLGSNYVYGTGPDRTRQWSPLSRVIRATGAVQIEDCGYLIAGAVDDVDGLPPSGAADEAWWVRNNLFAYDGADWVRVFQPQGIIALDLEDVTPEVGGTLQKTAFDAKGRRTHEDAATTDDLTEGASNLYFTEARADARISAWTASLASLTDAADDAAAAISGVPVGGMYRNGSALMVRIT